ncbi:MAG: penicillin-binding transpeptidase domain-containing protein, partial [Bacteroidota bacterium]
DSVAQKSRTLPISPEVAELLRRAMYLVVNGAGGTGATARIPGIAIAGKTGTAQNPHGKDHAWFIGFAPFENPKIAVCVLVENAGFGATHAAPLAGKLTERFLREESERLKTSPANFEASVREQTSFSRVRNEIP